METVEALEDKGLVVDGEFGVSVTPSGTEVRANVKFRSKEGALSKLWNRVNVNVGLNQVLPGSGE
jgi:hypothetical protein